MIKYLKIAMIVYAALLMQVSVFPAYLADPFQPNLLVLVVVYLGLREGGWRGGVLTFLLGLIEDCFSGIYLGLSTFSFLSIYLAMRKVSDRLYTDNLYVTLLVVFLATLANGLFHLLLLLLFSAADGMYRTLIPALLPQALVNSLVASIVFIFPQFSAREETR
ncbi:MAG TPA: rod shape-determining protein MreD [Geobacteraceae bacterium]|nr:rod shape-determining protein MreD [Geobacteraceae bacterium]